MGQCLIPLDLKGKQVKISARLQELTGNLFTTHVDPVPDARFDTLDKAIQNAILAHHSYDRDQEVLECASFFTYSSEGRSPVGSNKVDLVTEYGIVYHQGYRLEGGKLVEDGGCNVPTVLTFRVDDDGQYILAEYWEPRDGSYYADDIKAKYPAFVWPDTQKNLFEQKIAIFNQVMEGFQIGPEVIIDYLITDICERERWASGFTDLMTMCELQGEILASYGTDTLDYCFSFFENGSQDDLRGQVMAHVCSDILESMGIEPMEGWSWQQSGQDWYDTYMRNRSPITLKTESASSTGMTLLVTQTGSLPDKKLIIGVPYFLQENEENCWEAIPPVLEAWGWDREEMEINENETVHLEINWEWLYGELEQGQYRIGIYLYAESAEGDRDQQVVYAEFEIS